SRSIRGCCIGGRGGGSLRRGRRRQHFKLINKSSVLCGGQMHFHAVAAAIELQTACLDHFYRRNRFIEISKRFQFCIRMVGIGRLKQGVYPLDLDTRSGGFLQGGFKLSFYSLCISRIDSAVLAYI